MHIFYKRPLCLILSVMLGGFVLFSRGNFYIRFTLVLAALVLLFVSGLIFLINKRSCVLLKLCALLLLLSTLISYLYFDMHFKIADKYKGDVKIEGKITELDSSSAYTTKITVDTTKINGKKASHRLTGRISKDDAAYIYLGANISFNGRLENIETNDGFDSRSYYYSDKISAKISEYSSLKILPKEKPTLSEELSVLKENISRQAMLSMGSDAGSLFAALFMGERSYLSGRLSLDFSRIGISHILALSGMHLAIISLGLTKLLSMLSVGKKSRTLILGTFILFYMALTGFSASVVRAGLMLIISYALFFFASARDLPTNLVVSVFLICSVTPYAIFDIGLWLSALATLGIVSMSELFNNKKSAPKYIKNPILFFTNKFKASLLSSFFAISATMALSAELSGRISLLGAFSTFVFSLLAEIFIYAGILSLGIGMIFPTAGRFVMTPLYYAIDKAADKLSRLRFAVISSDEQVLKIIIAIFTVLFFGFIVMKLKNTRIACTVLVFCFVIAHFASAIVTHTALSDDAVIYSKFEQQDALLLKSEGKAALIDSARYSESTSYEAVDFLLSQNIFTLDFYVASHYSFALDNAAELLFKYIKTNTLLVPSPENEEEAVIFSLLELTAERNAVNIVTYSKDEEIFLGSFKFSERYRVPYGTTTMQNAFEIVADGKHIIYLGSGMLSYQTRELSLSMITRADTVIFGSHGKSYTPTYVINDFFPNVKTLIFAGEKIRLSDSAAEEYKKKGTEVLTNLGNLKSLKVVN